MPKTCRQCSLPFEVTDSDRAFYDKVSPVFGGVKYPIPEPTFCPECRQQRRLSWRNERKLYKGKCNLCKKEIISIYDTDAKFPVYCGECWWGDRWDAMKYGRDFDFSKPFFEQFLSLQNAVPQMNLLQVGVENSQYTNFTAYAKNTYMSPGSYYVEDVYFLRKSQSCKDCCDSMAIDHCEQVYESMNSDLCHNSSYLFYCRGCDDSQFLEFCRSCSDCFMCSGLHHQQYCILNQKYSKEEYFQKKQELLQRSNADLLKEFLAFCQSIPKRDTRNIQCENSLGENLKNCKNARYCFDCLNVEDSTYILESVGVKDSMDINMNDKDVELCYEISSGGDMDYKILFSFCPIISLDSFYLFLCENVKNCFGCIGLRHKQYCILNKQYTREEYELLVPKIIAHMRKTGEWGEFFPASISPFGYNETVANEYFPLTREEALAKGFKWSDYEAPKPQAAKVINAELMKKLPDSIDQIPDDVLNWALTCEVSGKLFKIQPAELVFYRKMKLPIPRRHPDVRHADRMALRNPRKLWKRSCAECAAEIETTYSPERPEKVLCEACYLKAVV